MKPGYKQTEVGVIPEQWDVAPLSREIGGLDAGVSVNSVDEAPTDHADDRAVLKTSAVASGQFLPHECKVIASRDVARAKLSPRKDSIIISRMNTPDLVGECGYVFSDFPNLFLPDRLWMTRKRNGSDVCVHWLNYLLSSKPYKMRIKGIATGTSGSMKNIGKDALLSMPIPYPKSVEQHAIATALSDVDELLGGLDRIIAKKRDLKRATMQELLTGHIRLPTFHGVWQEKTLFELAECKKELFDDGDWIESEHIRKEGIRLIQTGNIGIGCFVEKDDKKYINEASFKSLRCKQLTQGDLLICRLADPAGRSCVLPDINEERIVTSVDVTIFRPPSELTDRRFLSQVFSTSKWFKDVSERSGGTTHKRISRGALGRLTISLPSPTEQTAIAEVLTAMDVELACLDQRREKTRALKQGMMQQLLTGKLRLI
ncbi:MAG: restriction endonuclease subunit S [Fimbriimonadaceae bacterium]